MAETTTCGKCGVMLSPYAPPGLCANCMLLQGLDALSIVDAEARDGDQIAPETSQVSSLPSRQVKYFGDYELLEEIARGGMGIVYRSRQVSLNRIVAVKMLLLGPLSSPDLVKRFRAEASAAASLRHPNIVAIHEVGVHQGLHYFAMDFVEGQSLAAVLANGPLPAQRAAGYLQTVAEAVDYAHERGLLHRDLKPSNVLLDKEDRPHITDFGLAKRLEGDSELTLSGQVLGSPNYMPPEQAEAKRGQLSRRSDVYAMGAMLYHLLTGRPPFVSDTITGTLSQVINSEPVAPRLLNPSVPRDLDTLCLKCLEKDPGKRYATARALADELNRFLRHEPIQARPIGRWEKMWRYCRRNPGLSALSGATALLLLALAILSPIAAFWINRERQRGDQVLYNADMSLAQRDWEDGDLGSTRRHLQAHLPHGREKDLRSFEWFFFRNLCEADEHSTLRGHTEAVRCVTFSRDGTLLATGSAGDNDPVVIWNAATGAIVQKLPKQNVISLAFSPDGRMLGVGGRDQVAVWNLETGRAVFKREAFLGNFRIAFSPTGTLLVIGNHGSDLGIDDDGHAELWDYVTGEKKRVFENSGGYVALSRAGDLLATGNSDEKTVRIWDIPTGVVVSRMQPAAVIALEFSPDGRTLATSDWVSEVKLWDVRTGRMTDSLIKSHNRIWSLSFSRKGRFLAMGGPDQTVSLWDLTTRELIEQLRGHGGAIMSVSISPDGQTVASGSRDKTAMLWGIHPRRSATTISNIISRPIFSADSRLFAAGIGHDEVAVWEVANLQRRTEFTNAFDAVGFGPDGRSVITRGTNYFLRTYDLATRAEIATVSGQSADKSDSYAALSPDRKTLLTGVNEGSLMFSDVATGALLGRSAHARGNRIFHIDFSPIRNIAATAGRQAESASAPAAEIWDVATHQNVATLLGHTQTVLSAVFSPDGKTLATCSADASIRFWDTATWKETGASLTLKEFAHSLAYSPNGRTLASDSMDRTLRFWNVSTRQELGSVKLGNIKYIFFSPNGQTLAVWLWDDSLRLLSAPIIDKDPSQ